ncbi:MAG: DUF2959 family protein, partial [Planctomycetota bacterium]
RSQTSSNAVETSIDQVQQEIAAAKVYVDASAEDLQTLLATEDQATLPARYELFSTSLDRLKTQREQLVSRADDMLDRRQEYIANWRSTLEQLQNPALRQSAHDRMTSLSEQFSRIRQQVIEASFAMKPMIETLEGVESTLSYDLRMSALEQVSEALPQTPLDTSDIEKQLSLAQQELAQLNENSITASR